MTDLPFLMLVNFLLCKLLLLRYEYKTRKGTVIRDKTALKN